MRLSFTLHKPSAVPQIFQIEAVECGAAALAMVLAYFKKWVPLEHVRDRCGISRDGSDAFKMAQAAEYYGLQVKAVNREPEQLAQLPLPQILYWEFNHFVVLTKVDKQGFHINDPATGTRCLSAEQFSNSFTGLCLCFKPAKNFVADGKKPSLIDSIIQRTQGLSAAYKILLLLNLLLTLPGLAMAGLTRIFLDDYLIAAQHHWLWPLLAAMLCGTGLSFIIVWLQQKVLLKLQTRMALSDSANYTLKILRMPFSFFAQRSSGELVQRIRLNNQVANALSGPVAEAGLNALNIVLYLILIALYNFTVALASAVCIVCILFIYTRFNALAQQRHQQWQILQGQAYAVAAHGLQQFSSYRAQGAETLLMQRWLGAEAASLSAQQKTLTIDAGLRAAPTVAQGFLMGLILILSAFEAIQGQVSFGSLISLQLLAGLLVQPIAELMQLNGQIQKTAGALLRLDDLHNYPQAEKQELEKTVPETFHGSFELKQLCYAYPPNPPLIYQLSCHIPAGCITGIVGKSGSGKSTLAKMLVGLLEPQQGEILLDGQLLQQWPAALRKNLIAYIEQSGQLMHGSVHDNISLWREDISSAEVIAAAKQADVHEAIVDKANAYQTRHHPAHSVFSGGEVQRLTIARALCQDPMIVILDEATSALDTVSEANVISNLKASGKTVILITHRPSSILRCDNLLVLDEGSIVDQGPTQTLLQDSKALQAILAHDHATPQQVSP
ncbi:MAG: ATP-binding cassette domain-containing protein [Pseudomonadales bacterium]|nr:ATP-binding cassette domain-containing protein [Pseudomonadales bacterium]